MSQQREGDIMTIDEVAAYLRLGRRAVYRLAQSGELPGRKILNRWRFHIEDVAAWVRSGDGAEWVKADSDGSSQATG